MQIDFESFQQYIMDKESKISQSFQLIDRDHSGEISAQDLVSPIDLFIDLMKSSILAQCIRQNVFLLLHTLNL